MASSSVNSGKAIGSTIHFRKNSTSGTNPNYFSNLDSVDPNTNQNSGFRRRGEFNLVDITTAYFDPNNNSHTIEYSLSGSVNTSIIKRRHIHSMWMSWISRRVLLMRRRRLHP